MFPIAGGIETDMNLIWTPAQLAILAKVVDLNGFSAAARALGVPKAAVSRAVADLEKTLGVRVLERTTRRIALTPAGRLLYPHARRVGEESDAARSAIARLLSPEGRPLRVVADPTYGRVLLAPLVPRFLESFAHVPLEVTLDAHQLAEGAWDVAIRTHPPAEEAIVRRLLGAPPALLCATPQYLQQRGTPERPDELRAHDLLTPDASERAEFRLHLSRGAQRDRQTAIARGAAATCSRRSYLRPGAARAARATLSRGVRAGAARGDTRCTAARTRLVGRGDPHSPAGG